MEKLSRTDMLMSMLEKEPDDIFLNYALAVEYVGARKYQEAEKQFIKTKELDPGYLPSYYQLGQVSEKLNKTEEALSYYLKGLELAKQQNNNKAINELNEAIWMLE